MNICWMNFCCTGSSLPNYGSAEGPPPSGSWWRHQMETFSALLALCAGNSPVPVNSPHKGQWRGALMFSLICAWINDWVNNREAGDLRRHRGHYGVNVMDTNCDNGFAVTHPDEIPTSVKSSGWWKGSSSGWLKIGSICHPDELDPGRISSGWLVNAGCRCMVSHPDVCSVNSLCHPDDLTEVGISSGWVTVHYHDLCHPDEIGDFEFSQHAVALQCFRTEPYRNHCFFNWFVFCYYLVFLTPNKKQEIWIKMEQCQDDAFENVICKMSPILFGSFVL